MLRAATLEQNALRSMLMSWAVSVERRDIISTAALLLSPHLHRSYALCLPFW